MGQEEVYQLVFVLICFRFADMAKSWNIYLQIFLCLYFFEIA